MYHWDHKKIGKIFKNPSSNSNINTLSIIASQRRAINVYLVVVVIDDLLYID